jgi:hypothetical protein
MPTLRTHLAMLLVALYCLLVVAGGVLPALFVGGIAGVGAGLALAVGFAQLFRRPFGVAVDRLIARRRY